MTLRESNGAVEQENAQAENGICVVGTPRGGNSLVAGALQRLGVYLGEEEELPAPDGTSPLGSFELPRISELNDALVEHLDLGSLDAPVPPRGWERDAQLKPLGERARSALDEAFGEARIWAWKDARNAVTLPFWQRLLSGTRYVICIRNPLDAAQSLRAVDDGQELEPYMSIWLRTVALAMINTSGQPRIVIDYDDFVSTPVRTARRLARFAGLGGELTDADIERALGRFVDPSLALFRTPAEIALDGELTTRDCATLYRELLRLRPGDPDRDPEPEAMAAEWQAVDRLADRLLHATRPAMTAAMAIGRPTSARMRPRASRSSRTSLPTPFGSRAGRGADRRARTGERRARGGICAGAGRTQARA